jgi:hypothetical protein
MTSHANGADTRSRRSFVLGSQTDAVFTASARYPIAVLLGLADDALPLGGFVSCVRGLLR